MQKTDSELPQKVVLKYPKSFHPSVTMQFGKVIAQCNNWNGTVNYYYYFPYKK